MDAAAQAATVGPGSVCTSAKCHSCGGEVQVKLNKNLTAYYFCTGDAMRDGCGHHEKWNRRNSDEFRRLAVARRKALEAAAANDNRPVREVKPPAPAAPPGGPHKPPQGGKPPAPPPSPPPAAPAAPAAPERPLDALGKWLKEEFGE